MGQYLFIVARDKPDLCEYLTGWFSGIPTVEVFMDRRRRGADTSGPGWGQGDRRTRKELDIEIRQTGFAIVGSPPSSA